MSSLLFEKSDSPRLRQVVNYGRMLHTCMATGKSFCASGGKNTSTAFFGNGWLPVGGVPTSMMCSCAKEKKYKWETRRFRYKNADDIKICCPYYVINISHLPSSLASDSEAEQSRLLCIPLHLELGKAGSMAFNGLRNLSVNRVELHGSNHPILLKKAKQRTQICICNWQANQC